MGVQTVKHVKKSSKMEHTTFREQSIRNTYFLSIICTPQLLHNPFDKSIRFSISLWADKQIKSIMQTANYVQIVVNTKRSLGTRELLKKEFIEDPNTTQSQFKSTLQQLKKNWDRDYPHFKRTIELKRIDSNKNFDKWVDSMKKRNFIGWYMPLREEGPKLRKFVMSKEALKMLGYDPIQFNLQFEKYTDAAVDFLSGQAYKTCFLHYFRSFSNFMDVEIRNGDLQNCVKSSELVLTNQLKGKNNVRYFLLSSVKVEMKFSMIDPFSICFDFIRVLSKSEEIDQGLKNYKSNLILKRQKTTYRSLSSVTKFPKSMCPTNKVKICSYEIIREPEIEYKQIFHPDSGSSSQYKIQDRC